MSGLRLRTPRGRVYEPVSMAEARRAVAMGCTTVEPRYYVVESEGDLYCWSVQDTLYGRRTPSSPFLSEEEARASVPEEETDPGITWG